MRKHRGTKARKIFRCFKLMYVNKTYKYIVTALVL